jgi:hypothetical protein
MTPDLNDDDLWQSIKAVITEMYLRQFSMFELKDGPATFREFKILFGISFRIMSSGYYEVSYNKQIRKGHISDLVGENIPPPADFQLPKSILPSLDKRPTKYSDIIKIPGNDDKNKTIWDMNPLSPFNSNDIITPSDLMKMPLDQVQYYNARMKVQLEWDAHEKGLSKTEFDNLYYGSWKEVEYSLKEKIQKKFKDEEEFFKDFSEAMAPPFPSSPLPGLIYEDSLINTEDIEGAVNMADNIENTTDSSQNSGWHAPVIHYDPNYVRPKEESPIPPRFPKYSQDTLLNIYTDIGRVAWNPNAPTLIGPNGRSNQEISGETLIHTTWLEIAKVAIQNKDYMTSSFIPTLRRKLEYEKIVLDRKSMAERKYPSNDLFNTFIVKRFEAALKRDGNPDVKRKTILKDVKKLLKDAGFIHMYVHEDVVGAATLARNVMLTLPETDRDKLTVYQKTVQEYFNHVLNHKNDSSKSTQILSGKPPAFTVRGYVDFEASTYPKYMGEEMTSYYSKIKNNPTDMIYQIMKHNVDMMSNIINNMPGEAKLESSVYIVNPIEWALDFVRYATERMEYHVAAKDLDQVFMRDLETDPIYEPIPLRMAINLAVKFPADLDFGSLPAQIVDAYEANNNVKNLIKKELWDGQAFMTPVRELPWRNQIAPQLWDTTFFCSTMVRKMNRKGETTTSLLMNDPYDKDHTESIYNNTTNMSRRILSGKDAYTDSSRPLMGRKTASETHDEFGWYLSFYNPSKMEGL